MKITIQKLDPFDKTKDNNMQDKSQGITERLLKKYKPTFLYSINTMGGKKDDKFRA